MTRERADLQKLRCPGCGWLQFHWEPNEALRLEIKCRRCKRLLLIEAGVVVSKWQESAELVDNARGVS